MAILRASRFLLSALNRRQNGVVARFMVFRHYSQPAPAVSTVLSTSLSYLKPLEIYQTEKPYHINLPADALPQGAYSNEVSEEYANIRIESVRGREHRFGLDKNGFQIFQGDEGGKALSSAIRYEDYDDPDTVRKKYYPAVNEFLVKNLGAEHALVYTHEVRRRDVSFPALPRGTGMSPQPVQGVHVDLTPRWAKERMAMVFSSKEIERFSKRRWQVVNVWRPLFGPLQDWPLGLLDFRSINPQADLIPSDNVYTHMITETYNVFHSEAHRWYYVEDMQSDEVLAFKSFDTKTAGGNARLCPHAAFNNQLTPADARPRESIECLAYVIYKNDSDDSNDQSSVEDLP